MVLCIGRNLPPKGGVGLDFGWEEFVIGGINVLALEDPQCKTMYGKEGDDKYYGACIAGTLKNGTFLSYKRVPSTY